MLKIFAVYLSIIYNASYPMDISQVETDSTIEWSSARSLIREDFKSKKHPLVDVDAQSFFTIEIVPKKISSGDIYYIEIKALFIADKSWCIDDANDTLLSHEQVHFDIYELVARKMRASIRDSIFVKENFERVIRELRIFKDNYHGKISDKYDSETFNGTYLSEQSRWEKKIKDELLAMKDYELVNGIERYKIEKNSKRKSP
jgi:hypothetical protein